MDFEDDDDPHRENCYMIKTFGSCDGLTGHCGAGLVIYYMNEPIEQYWTYTG